MFEISEYTNLKQNSQWYQILVYKEQQEEETDDNGW